MDQLAICVPNQYSSVAGSGFFFSQSPTTHNCVKCTFGCYGFFQSGHFGLMAITMSAAKLKPAPPEPLGVLRGHRVPVNTVSYVNSSSIISGAADGVVKLWNLKTRRESASASAHSKAGVLHTQLLDGARFVTQGRDGFVKVWDTHTFSSQSDALSEFYCGSFSFTKLATLRWPAAAASDAQHLIVCPGSDSEQVSVPFTVCMRFYRELMVALLAVDLRHESARSSAVHADQGPRSRQEERQVLESFSAAPMSGFH